MSATLADSRSATDDRASMDASVSTWLGSGLIAVGLGLAVVSLLGPFGTGVIDYHVTETLRNQTIGLDAISLLLVAPVSVLAALLVLRRHVAGAALGLGIGAYTSYMLIQYILGPEYERLPGNNELLFPLYLALFTLGWLVVIAAWNAFDAERLPDSHRRDRLIGRLVLPLLAFFAFSRYLPGLVDWMSSSPEDPGYLAGPTFSWAIALLDLGLFLPATVAACFGLVRGTRWAHKALYTVVGWFALVGPAVAAMAITMYNDDPNASGVNVVLMTALGLVFALFALYIYLPLFRARKATHLSLKRRFTMRGAAKAATPAAELTHSAAAHRTIGGYVWFALMVGGWVTFVALLAFSEPTLGELWRDVRDLPLVVEGLVWLLLFPFVLALGVWDSSWETWLRLLLVGCFAVGWSLAFWPRRRAVR